jgi:hypothetical protein
VHLIEQLSLFAKQGELLTKVPSQFNRNRTQVRQVIRQPNRKLSPIETDELVRLYESGLDLTALGRHFGMHRQTARSLLLKRGIELRPQWPVLSEAQIAAAAESYLAGMSTYQLGEHYGVGPEGIRRHLIARGVRMRPRGHGDPRLTG